MRWKRRGPLLIQLRRPGTLSRMSRHCTFTRPDHGVRRKPTRYSRATDEPGGDYERPPNIAMPPRARECDLGGAPISQMREASNFGEKSFACAQNDSLFHASSRRIAVQK